MEMYQNVLRKNVFELDRDWSIFYGGPIRAIFEQGYHKSRVFIRIKCENSKTSMDSLGRLSQLQNIEMEFGLL